MSVCWWWCRDRSARLSRVLRCVRRLVFWEIPTAATVYLAATTRNMPPDWHAAPLWTAEVTFSDVVKLNQHGTAPFTRLDSVQLWQLSPTGETP